MKIHRFTAFWIMLLFLAIGLTKCHHCRHRAPVKNPAIDTTGSYGDSDSPER